MGFKKGVFSELLEFVFLFELLLLCTARAHVHYFDFVLKETNFTRLCSTKNMLTVNDSFPGPVILVHKGDTVFVNVHNLGSYGVTIHWHGVKQPRNPWSDGADFITQCQIEPRTNFTYEVIFSKEEGTLWWHAHSDWTRSSVHGAITILPAEGTTYPFPKPDEEKILVLASWYKGDVRELVVEDYDASVLPTADAYVINGQPGDFCECSNETTHRWLVDHGKTYHLRIINAAMNSELFFAIAEHNFTVVGMDGGYIKPIETSVLVISPGQTMDVLFTANQSLGSYYIAIRDFYTGSFEPDVVNVTTAIMEYRGNYTPPLYPIFPSNLPFFKDIAATNPFYDRLRSLASQEHPIDVPRTIATHMYVTVSMNMIVCPNHSCPGLDGNKVGSSLNNISFTSPPADILLAYYRNLSGIYSTDFPDHPAMYYNFTGDSSNNTRIASKGTKVKMLNYNETVEVVFQGTNVMDASQNHPVHLHGHSYYVVGWGLGNFDNETDPKSYNLIDPPELNTIRVPKRGWVAIRFKASNPGVWLLHCHLSRHLTWGMNTVFIVKNGDSVETSIRDPPAYMPPCKDSSLNSNLQEFNGSIGNGNKLATT